MLDGLRDLFLSALRGEEKADVLVRKWNIEIKAIQEIYDKAMGGERIYAQPQIIRCKDCIHKPKPTEDYNPNERDGFEIKFPDYICPMQCEDAYYNRIPKDDWFCGNAERKEDGQTNR